MLKNSVRFRSNFAKFELGHNIDEILEGCFQGAKFKTLSIETTLAIIDLIWQ